MFHRLARLLPCAFAALTTLVADAATPSPEDAAHAFDDVVVPSAPGFRPVAEFPDLAAFYADLDAGLAEGRVVSRFVLPDAGGALRAEALAAVPASLDGKRCSLAYFRAMFDAGRIAQPPGTEIRSAEFFASNEIRFEAVTRKEEDDPAGAFPSWVAQAAESLWIKGRVLSLHCSTTLGDETEVAAALAQNRVAVAAWAAETLRANRLLPSATNASAGDPATGDDPSGTATDRSAFAPPSLAPLPPDPSPLRRLRRADEEADREAEELFAQEAYAREQAKGALLEPPNLARRRVLARLADLSISILGLCMGVVLLLRWRARRHRFDGVR